MQTISPRLYLGVLAAALSLTTAGPAAAHWRAGLHPHARAGVHAPWVAPPAVVLRAPALALIDFNVEPKTTRIWVDGSYRGTCEEFDGHPQKMALAPGRHHVRLESPAGGVTERTVELPAGYELNLDLGR